MGLGKRNVVTFDLKNYTHLILGEPKIGKTTLVKDIIKLESGTSDKGLFVEIGDETGYEGIDGLIFESPQTWRQLSDIIDEFLEGDHDFDFIVLDTINEWAKLADEQTLKDHFKAYGEAAKSVNQAFGGYGSGAKHSVGLFSEQLKRLKLSEYGVFLIGHNKVKSESKQGGEKYDVVTSDLFSNYYGGFSKKATIICNLITETSVRDKKLEGATRMMYFRSNGFVKSGTRLANIQESAEYGAQSYIDIVKEALKDAKDEDSHDGKFEEVDNDKALKESVKDATTIDDLVKEILSLTELIQDEVSDPNEKIMAVLNDNDVQDPTKIKDKDLARKVITDLKEVS